MLFNIIATSHLSPFKLKLKLKLSSSVALATLQMFNSYHIRHFQHCRKFFRKYCSKESWIHWIIIPAAHTWYLHSLTWEIRGWDYMVSRASYFWDFPPKYFSDYLRAIYTRKLSESPYGEKDSSIVRGGKGERNLETYRIRFSPSTMSISYRTWEKSLNYFKSLHSGIKWRSWAEWSPRPALL